MLQLLLMLLRFVMLGSGAVAQESTFQSGPSKKGPALAKLLLQV